MPTDDQLLQQLLEFLTDQFQESRKAQGATASTVRSLTTALRDADRTRQTEDDKFESVRLSNEQMRTAVLALIGHVSPRDFSKISAEDLLDLVPIEIIRGARDVHWARSKQQGLPLPPPPNVPTMIAQETSSGHVEIVPVIHAHRRKDDSVTIKRGSDGKTRIKASVEAKTIAGWIMAFITFAIFAWREIQHANENHGNQEQQRWQQPAPPPVAPALPVPQLSPPQISPPAHP